MGYTLGQGAPAAGARVVAVGGELDLNAVPELKASVDRALSRGAGTLVVDLSEATFIDSTAIGALAAVHQRLKRAGGALEVVCTDQNLLRVFEVVGLSRELSIHATRAAALRAAGS